MIECPECKHKHDPELEPKDNSHTWIWTCEKCKLDFEVTVEWHPVYFSKTM